MIRRTIGILILVLCAACAWADFTFVQISDTHVGVKEAAFNARYAEVIRQINELKPAFVIHTGDALTSWSPENADVFKELSKSLSIPLYIAPGNHDIQAASIPLMTAVNAWRRAFKYDRITFEQDDCVFIGLDSKLWNSGIAAEKVQLNWLKAELNRARGKRIFIFEHHPLFLKSPDDKNGDYFAVDNPVRGKILELLKEHKVEAVLTGHYHRQLESALGGTSFFTTPAVSFSCAADKGLTGYSVFHVFAGGFTHRFVDLRTVGAPPEFHTEMGPQRH